jgi:DNA-binding NtrC family response regulator
MKKIPGSLLAVDDNPAVLDALELFLKNKVEKVTTIRNPNQITSLLSTEDFDLVLLDMNFTAGINTGNEGLYWLKRILKTDRPPAVVLITAYGEINLAVQAIKEGATDFITKPWDNEKLLATVQTAIKLKQSQNQVRKLQNREKLLDEDIERHNRMITGNSEKMRKIIELIDKVACTDANVLILGENGTGKEVVAREIHKRSHRSKEAFVPVDLGAITESLFESEMFGHIKGSFTDARDNHTGRMETASGGSLFLDEIGNLSMPIQAKLLTTIENKHIMAVGSNKETPIDIRLICATNKDLTTMVTSHQFREDLLYRINTIEIYLPPLRERGDDIETLALSFLNCFSIKYGKPDIKLNSDAIDKLYDYPWPGNIRELKHTMERAVILSDNNILKPNDLHLPQSKGFASDSNTTLEDNERIAIYNSLERNGHNISETARELKIGRQTLYRKIQRYGLQ